MQFNWVFSLWMRPFHQFFFRFFVSGPKTQAPDEFDSQIHIARVYLWLEPIKCSRSVQKCSRSSLKNQREKIKFLISRVTQLHTISCRVFIAVSRSDYATVKLPSHDACTAVSESGSFKLCWFGKPVSAAIMINGNELHSPISNNKKFSTVVAKN